MSNHSSRKDTDTTDNGRKQAQTNALNEEPLRTITAKTNMATPGNLKEDSILKAGSVAVGSRPLQPSSAFKKQHGA